jgi:hypothetical protein
MAGRVFGLLFLSVRAYSHLWLAPKVLPPGKTKEKAVFLLLFARLFVPLHRKNNCHGNHKKTIRTETA